MSRKPADRYSSTPDKILDLSLDFGIALNVGGHIRGGGQRTYVELEVTGFFACYDRVQIRRRTSSFSLSLKGKEMLPSGLSPF